ncbi:MAG TPA: helix-turn-helix domain-containing protein [Polyangiaceae bacterium]|jgi:predicted DNA-binding transcriptional regulator AlpA
MNVVVLSPEQLQDIVEQALRAGLNAREQREVLTTEQCCTLLEITRKTLMRYVSEGLPCHSLSDREQRFLRGEVTAWIRSRSYGASNS